MTTEIRLNAMHLALALKPRTAADLVRDAGVIADFLEERDPSVSTDAPAPAKPRASRKAAVETQAAAPNESGVKPVVATSAVPAPAAATDVFGDTPAATQAAAVTEEPKAEKAKAATMDDVRAKLVAVQTHFGKKDEAMKLLAKYSPVLSGLKEADYAKLIEDCDAALKKPKS